MARVRYPDPSGTDRQIPCDAIVVEAARRKEAWAQDALFRRHLDLVSGLVQRLLGRDVDRDDIVQDSFTYALGALDRLHDPQAFASWICSIAVGTTHKVLRRRRLLDRLGLRHTASVDLDGLVGPTASPEIAAELRAICGVIDQLPPKVRIVFLLRRVEGLALPEIARMVGASLTTLKRRLAEAERAIGRHTAQA